MVCVCDVVDQWLRYVCCHPLLSLSSDVAAFMAYHDSAADAEPTDCATDFAGHAQALPVPKLLISPPLPSGSQKHTAQAGSSTLTFEPLSPGTTRAAASGLA